MSTQVLPYDVGEEGPAAEPEPVEEERREQRSWKHPVIQLVIQLVATLVPVAILVLAFAIAGDHLLDDVGWA